LSETKSGVTLRLNPGFRVGNPGYLLLHATAAIGGTIPTPTRQPGVVARRHLRSECRRSGRSQRTVGVERKKSNDEADNGRVGRSLRVQFHLKRSLAIFIASSTARNLLEILISWFAERKPSTRSVE
jgi:hypothetical protein